MPPSFTPTEKAVVIVAENVVNVNVLPRFDVASDEVVLAQDTKKSVDTPVVAPVAPETEIVHTIGNVARAGLMHARDDAVVGVP